MNDDYAIDCSGCHGILTRKPCPVCGGAKIDKQMNGPGLAPGQSLEEFCDLYQRFS